MTVTIHLRPETERQLSCEAARAGLTLAQYVQQLVEREAGKGANGAVTSGPSFEEMTGPFAKAVEATGMTEDELGDFFQRVVEEVRAERRARKGAGS
jgi:hypothetical protein